MTLHPTSVFSAMYKAVHLNLTTYFGAKHYVLIQTEMGQMLQRGVSNLWDGLMEWTDEANQNHEYQCVMCNL